MFTHAVFLPFCYMLFKGKRIDKRLVVFADAHNRKLPYSMKLLYRKFVSEGYRVETVFSDYGRDSYMTTLKNMIRFMKLYAQAGIVVICDYFLPVAAPKRKKNGTKVVQLWHACGIFKEFAYDAPDDIPRYYKGKVINNYDLVTVSSPACVPVYSSAMRLEKGIVRAVGVSRTDIFFSRKYREMCREKLYSLYPEARNKKIAVWAPTFRGNAALPYLEGKEDVLKLKSLLPDDWFLLIQLHPHFRDREISCKLPTEQLLPVTDLLISDYSTVIYEYSLFEKPLVLFAPDSASYTKQRGFYIDYYSLPGRIVTDKNELADALIEEYGSFDREKMRRFKERYMSACDGRSTERIFKILTDTTI